MFVLNSADLSAMLALFFFPFVRILAWLSFDPLLGNRSAPVTVRLLLALVLSIAIAPTLAPQQQVSLASSDAILVLLQQIAIGAAMGFTLRIVYAVIEFTGQLMGLQMGLSFATLFDPVNGAQTPVISQLLVMTTSLLLLAFNGHHLVIAALARSFVDLPVGAGLSAQGYLEVVKWAGVMFSTGLHIALPVTAALLTTNLTIGMMTRAAPQLNIFAVGFPLTLGAGFIVLYLTLTFLPLNIEQLWGSAVSIGSKAMAGVSGH